MAPRGPILDLAQRLENNHHWGNGRTLEQWVHDQPWRVLLALAIQFFLHTVAPPALKIPVCGSGGKLPYPFEFKVPAVWPSTCYHAFLCHVMFRDQSYCISYCCKCRIHAGKPGLNTSPTRWTASACDPTASPSTWNRWLVYSRRWNWSDGWICFLVEI